jgi:hypothetical protein
VVPVLTQSQGRASQKAPGGLLKGIVQADAFAGYDRLFDSGEIVEAACWAHARRKFYDVHMQQRPASCLAPWPTRPC